MKVRLLRPTLITGRNLPRGSVVDLPDVDAKVLILRRTAEPLPEVAPKKEEPKKRKPGRPPKTKEDKPDVLK